MSDVNQIYPDLFQVKHEMRPGWYCTLLVFFGKHNIGVLDTAFEETITDKVLPLIKTQGRSLDEVNLVVNTHRDGDHIKGNQIITTHTPAQIAAHRLEAEAIPEATIFLEDGDNITLGDRSLKVIHTPGHRPGAICLYQTETGLLITDDVVCGTREDLIRMDKEIYINSLRKLETLNAKTMIMSHPFQPAGKNILQGREIAEMLKASITIAENK